MDARRGNPQERDPKESPKAAAKGIQPQNKKDTRRGASRTQLELSPGGQCRKKGTLRDLDCGNRRKVLSSASRVHYRGEQSDESSPRKGFAFGRIQIETKQGAEKALQKRNENDKKEGCEAKSPTGGVCAS